MQQRRTTILTLACVFVTSLTWSAKTAPAKKPATQSAAKKAAPATTAKPAGAAATTPAPAPAVQQIKEGELSANVIGERKDKLTIGKIDPPAAFNLEDIQNFPEDRLHPVLNNPITFEEGRDFSSMMDALDDKMAHPWLPEVPRAPFLTMKPVLDKPAKDWRFAVIDQGGSPVYSQDGKGNPPVSFEWSGQDKDRGHIAVDTVYIPQLSTTDKEGYRHTYMGSPSQFAAFFWTDKGRSIVEISTKRLFLENKSEFTKEAPVYLDKVCDMIRAEARLPFAVQAYDSDLSLGRAREAALAKFFSGRLLIPETQVTQLEPLASDKRGLTIAITLNGTPGGADE